MPTTLIDGIATHYEIRGDGPPLLMFSPGGFDATLDKWTTLGVYERIRLLDHLPKKYSCIVFDRRETGRSGGRVESISWDHFVAQAKGLLDHLGHSAAHLLGGCMGCSVALAFAVAHPRATRSMVLYWPVGGAHFRIKGQGRFAAHLAEVESQGLARVVDRALKTTDTFGKDPRVGPWAPAVRANPDFAAQYAEIDVERYKRVLSEMAGALYDRDTAPGAEPEDLMQLDIPALIVPGRDPAHATSAARYLEECLPNSDYWDILPEDQTEAVVPARILAFLDGVGA
jgi:pimeloyl-ACP methyl ester carboxylesterase